MNQAVIDFFCAMGLGMSQPLLVGLQQNATWFWCSLAVIGLVWSIGISAFEEEGIVIVLRQLVCALLSATLLWGYVKVDLPVYDYAAPGKLEAQYGSTTGAAVAPTYATFVIARQLSISVRGVIAKGQTTSIPNAIAEADVLTTGAEVLDDAQLKANLMIWNQVIAPYLLKQDASLEKSLVSAGVLGEFMVPVPDSTDFLGTEGTNAAKVRSILDQSQVKIGDMLCTLSPLITSMATKMGATNWTSDTSMCTDTSISINFVATAKTAATMATVFNAPPQVAWDKGTAMTQAMMSALGSGTNVASESSIGALYSDIGHSVLYVAGNRYAATSDYVVLLGTVCDKMATSDVANACYATQVGLAAATRGVVSSLTPSDPEDKRGILTKAGDWVGDVSSGIGGFLSTSVFRLLMATLAGIVKSVIPYALGIMMCCSFPASVIGVYLLLWPGKFNTAIEWIAGPIMFSCLWSALNGLWTEMDTYLSDGVALIGSVVSGDRMMGSNVTSVVISIGYLTMPFLAWNILFGSSGRLLQKTTNMSQRMVEGGIAMALAGAKLAGGPSKSAGAQSPGTSSQSASGTPGQSGSTGTSNAPPSSLPASAAAGANNGGPGSGRSSGGRTASGSDTSANSDGGSSTNRTGSTSSSTSTHGRSGSGSPDTASTTQTANSAPAGASNATAGSRAATAAPSAGTANSGGAAPFGNSTPVAGAANRPSPPPANGSASTPPAAGDQPLFQPIPPR